jgi:type IV pilus assembly protein PilW
MTTQPRFFPSSRQSQRGLSLVELMVSLTIGLFLLGAVGIIYVNTVTTSRSSTQESQMNEDASLALELLQQQIRLTGFSNVNTASGDRLFTGQAVFGCQGDSGATANGSAFSDDDAAFSALACDGGTRQDAFAVRYEASLLNSQSVTNAGVQFPGNCAHEALAAWDASAEGAASATPLALADNRYYVADDPANNNTPTLYCQGRVGGAGAGPAGTGYGAATALIPNIEDMQVQYAVTALPSAGLPIPHQVNGYVDADHAVLGAAAANWSRVAALRICLIARSAQPVPTGDNPVGTANPDGTTLVAGLGTYVDCDGVSQTATDRFIRRAYVTTIQLRNTRPGLPADYEVGGYSWNYMYDN